MDKPIVVVIGTEQPEILEAIRLVTEAYRKQERATWSAMFKAAPELDVPSTSAHELVRLAHRQAVAIMRSNAGDAGVAIASGTVTFLYNRGARKARFLAHAIVSVCEAGCVNMAMPSAYPEDAEAEFISHVQNIAATLPVPEDVPDSLDDLCSIAVQTWKDAPFEYDPPCIELML